jgi:type IV pilus assembly protein PilQ
MKTTTCLTQRLFASFALAFALITPAVVASAADPDSASNSVQSLDYSTLQGGKILIKVGMKNPPKTTPAGFSINNPPRIALDLTDTSNGLDKNTINVNQGPLRNVNVVQAGNRTRLVLNLSKTSQYDTRIDGNALLITVQESGTQATDVGSRFAEAQPSAAKHSIRDIDFRRGASGDGRVVVTLSDTTTGIDIRKQGAGLNIDFINADAPANLQRRLDVNDFATPVQFIDTQSRGGNVRMTVQPKGDYEYSAYQADNQFILEVRAKAEDKNKVSDGKTKYTGEKLSLNFQNVEVRSVLQVIADFTGLNIITSDTVTGNLTLRLKDVPWDQALDIIMQSKGLDKRVNGNVIWVAPKDELVAKEKAELESRESTRALEPLVLKRYQLNYLRADQASRILLGQVAAAGDNGEDVTCSAQAQGVKATQQATAAPVATGAVGAGTNRIISARGTASSEPQTNTLLINDTASKQAEIAEMLNLIDVPARQVMIEARVVVADDGFSRQLGVRFGVKGSNTVDNSRIGLSNSAANAATTGGTVAPFNVDLPVAGAAGTLGLSLLNLGRGNLISLELSALEADNRGKIISSPRVITANQKPAVILQGTQLPNVTPGTANSPATVTFKDAFLCLLVNPQILNNDSIILNVEVQKDAPGTPVNLGSGGIAYPIDTKRVKTQIRVQNGETAVLGGIYEQNKRGDVTKVPFLGDIPVLGHLFRTDSRQDAKTELLVFLTPRIVRDDAGLR